MDWGSEFWHPKRTWEEEKKGPAQQDLNGWDVQRVCRWLDELQLGQYNGAFETHEIDGPALLEFQGFTKGGPESVKLLLGMLDGKLCITTLGHQLRLIRALRVLV
eukprot:g8252.t1